MRDRLRVNAPPLSSTLVGRASRSGAQTWTDALVTGSRSRRRWKRKTACDPTGCTQQWHRLHLGLGLRVGGKGLWGLPTRAILLGGCLVPATTQQPPSWVRWTRKATAAQACPIRLDTRAIVCQHCFHEHNATSGAVQSRLHAELAARLDCAWFDFAEPRGVSCPGGPLARLAQLHTTYETCVSRMGRVPFGSTHAWPLQQGESLGFRGSRCVRV